MFGIIFYKISNKNRTYKTVRSYGPPNKQSRKVFRQRKLHLRASPKPSLPLKIRFQNILWRSILSKIRRFVERMRLNYPDTELTTQKMRTKQYEKGNILFRQ